jgi:streptogramin lyase
MIQCSMFPATRVLVCALSAACCLLTAGCGVSSTSPSVASGAAISGRVFGGQQPVVGASISLYAAGSGGPGMGASTLLTTVTGTGGSFSISSDYDCPSGSAQVYLVARGGNPGLTAVASNPALALMVALGNCSSLATTQSVTINEATTVAAAWGLAQFLGPGATVGASSSNAVGLRNAFAVANNLANSSTGTAAGAALPAGAVMESAKLYALADALAACVNSDGTSACGPLFSAATEGGSVPANTLDAAIDIVRSPGSKIGAVFNAVPPQGPFQPSLSQVPNDWTMSIRYTGGGLYGPSALAVDSAGSVWTANYFGATATKLSPTGVAEGFSDASLRESYGITVDPQDNAWVTNEQSSGAVNGGGGSLTKFNSSGQVQSGKGYSAGGIYYPYAVAADSNSDIWVADYGRSGATLLANDGTSLSGASGFPSSSLPYTSSVALDGTDNAWFGAEGGAARITPSGVMTMFPCCIEPSGIAIDQAENVWLPDYLASSLVELNSSGTMIQTIAGIGGLASPESVAIDGGGNVWVADFRADALSAFTGASSGGRSGALSPASGFGLDAGLNQPFALALDASGNLWVASFAADEVVQFVGIATPVKTPLVGPPATP